MAHKLKPSDGITTQAFAARDAMGQTLYFFKEDGALVPIDGVGSGVCEEYIVTASSHLIARADFVYTSGVGEVRAWVQTSIDEGATWIDIMCFAFTLDKTESKLHAVGLVSEVEDKEPMDGLLDDNKVERGICGDRYRVKYASIGTLVATLTITGHSRS